MDRELARGIVATGYRSALALQELIPRLKQELQPSEYDQFLKAIATVSAEISLEILNPVFKQFPELKKEAGL
jgi:hypothetical protein